MLLMEGAQSVSQLLIAWRKAEPAALEELTPRVYHELQKPAQLTALISKGGGDAAAVRLEDCMAVSPGRNRLAAVDERKARVELRDFGGAPGLTVPTVKRDLRPGEAWLRRFRAGQTP